MTVPATGVRSAFGRVTVGIIFGHFERKSSGKPHDVRENTKKSTGCVNEYCPGEVTATGAKEGARTDERERSGHS